MKIADSLRHECMPEMVYSICKMSLEEEDREALQRLITLNHNDKQTQDQFNKVYRFACDCDFIHDTSGKVTCLMDPNKLLTFKQFRMQVANKVFNNKSTKFVRLAEWYMKKEEFYIFSQDTSKTLAAYANDDLGLEIDEFYALGFRFWMVDMGFLAFQSYRKSAAMFACHNYLIQWIGEQNFEINNFIPVRFFMEKLVSDCPLFDCMIKNNHLNMAFSMALRVLKKTGYIDARRVKDSSDVWHISDSVLDPWITNDANTDSKYKNEFSEILIKG